MEDDFIGIYDGVKLRLVIYCPRLNWISETGLSMNEVEQLKKEIEELKQIIESKNNQVESKNRHIKRLEGIISNMKKQAQQRFIV